MDIRAEHRSATFLLKYSFHYAVYYLYCRGEAGELRLGIRRAARPRNGLPDSIIKNQSSYPNVLSPVANALSSNGSFHVFYSPRYCCPHYLFSGGFGCIMKFWCFKVLNLIVIVLIEAPGYPKLQYILRSANNRNIEYKLVRDRNSSNTVSRNYDD